MTMTTTAFWQSDAGYDWLLKVDAEIRCAGELRTEQTYGLHPRAAADRGAQTDLAELRRCGNTGCQRFGVPMVQPYDAEARAYQCRSCGQFDHGG